MKDPTDRFKLGLYKVRLGEMSEGSMKYFSWLVGGVAIVGYAIN